MSFSAQYLAFIAKNIPTVEIVIEGGIVQSVQGNAAIVILDRDNPSVQTAEPGGRIVDHETWAERVDNLDLGTLRNAGLSLVCYKRTHWKLETTHGTEIVPDWDDAEHPETIEPYCEGEPDLETLNRVSEWVAYWSMPGYLDKGEEYTGESESAALSDWLESYASDDWQEHPEDIVFEALERLATLADAGDEIAIKSLSLFLGEPC